MAAAAPVNEPLGWLSSRPRDPLREVEERSSRNILFMSLLGSGKGSFLEILPSFVSLLQEDGPEKIVSLLPEKNFNAFTLVEYVLTYLAFIIDDQSEFMEKSEVENARYSETIEQLDSLLKELYQHLKFASIFDEEQAGRVEALYRIILDASRYRKRRRSDDDGSTSTGSDTPERWQPFFSANFPNESSRMFMSGLRQIFMDSRLNPTEKNYQELRKICESTDLDNVFSSDIHIHVALLMILGTVEQAAFKPKQTFLTLEEFEFLLEKICKLNRRSFVCAPPSRALLSLAQARIITIRGVMQRSVPNADLSSKALKEFLLRENFALGP